MGHVNNSNDMGGRKSLYEGKQRFKTLSRTRKFKHVQKVLDDMYRNRIINKELLE